MKMRIVGPLLCGGLLLFAALANAATVTVGEMYQQYRMMTCLPSTSGRCNLDFAALPAGKGLIIRRAYCDELGRYDFPLETVNGSGVVLFRTPINRWGQDRLTEILHLVGSGQRARISVIPSIDPFPLACMIVGELR